MEFCSESESESGSGNLCFVNYEVTIRNTRPASTNHCELELELELDLDL